LSRCQTSRSTLAGETAPMGHRAAAAAGDEPLWINMKKSSF
jgi:hypothetical protein